MRCCFASAVSLTFAFLGRMTLQSWLTKTICTLVWPCPYRYLDDWWSFF
jgi:hypothetical protein